MLAGLLAAITAHADDSVLRVGSKRFTESYILGEIIAQTAATQVKVEHKQGLGNTAIVLAALEAGSIDVYPEYTGTIDQEILKHTKPATIEELNRELKPKGLGVAVPLGFNNTYALAVRNEPNAPRTLTELAARKDMRLGLSHEFIGRADGWPGLSTLYGLYQQPRGLDHGIAYEALAQKQVDVIDIYSTDAKISQYGLRVLDDDRHYFPRYDAVLLYRLDAAQRFPAAWRAIQQLHGSINATDMIAMNAAAELQSQPFAAIARNWLARHPAADVAAVAGTSTARPAAAAGAASPAPGASPATTAASSATSAASPATTAASLATSAAISGATGTPSANGDPAATSAALVKPGLLSRLFADDLWKLTRQHITLVAVSVMLACVVGIPLGVLAAYRPALKQPVMAAVGVLQTIPSLALLAMLIPLLGAIGPLPALVALFVYALLPIVRNSCTGIDGIPPGLKQAAEALGLKPAQRLLHIELPLATPIILAGVKTAAVMSVGTATIAAFIGAGGYGERITTGLALNDNDLLLAGAIPAAALALITQAIFELLERAAQLRRVKL
ncbi:glycine betaine ABC transporter substrate-binding protein [Pseudoduganella sp. RAF53_2]|uniref:glycine betaine ABC transporter substrate-binding protein n=1 Tax=unclassified Pseudoduganella TaxID=2637179 RepID=UPI003F95F431